jgi:hypothetical protein
MPKYRVTFPLEALSKNGLEMLRRGFGIDEDLDHVHFTRDGILDALIPDNLWDEDEIRGFGLPVHTLDDDCIIPEEWWTILGLPPEIEAEARRFVSEKVGGEVHFE